MGVILGTGSNACYVEKVANAELFNGDSHGQEVIINCEWGAFGDTGTLEFIRTEYDRIIDDNSINKGNQLFEKMISGMYMGEIVRLVLVKFTRAGFLFQGKTSDLLETKDKFFTKYVSEIESERPGEYNNVYEILHELGLYHATDDDCVNVRYICECVSSRAAHIVSAAIAMLIIKMDDPDITVSFPLLFSVKFEF
jgi:hexokinase